MLLSVKRHFERQHIDAGTAPLMADQTIAQVDGTFSHIPADLN
jgi:hypothetical protein